MSEDENNLKGSLVEVIISEGPNTLKRRPTSPVVYFNRQWEELYLFTEYEGMAKCLVCHKVLTNVKKFNLQRHYSIYHSKDYAEYEKSERAAEIEMLKANLMRSIVTEDETSACESAVRVSYQIALHIAKSLHSLSDGELVKECLKTAAEVLCPSQVQLVESVSLSRATITHRIQDLAGDVLRQLTEVARSFIAFSLALDESTDVSGTTQLAMFIRGVNAKLGVTEEMLDLVPLGDATTGLDVLTCVEETVENFRLSWDLLESVTTNGAAVMVGGRVGFVPRLKDKLKDQAVTGIHGIVRQEVLCGKSVVLTCVMRVVVRTTNIIRAQGLKHRQFKAFLEDHEREYGDVPYHTETCWLSRGKVLDLFLQLLDEIAVFMDRNGTPEPLLQDLKWRTDFAFLVDLTGHLNELSATLQGKHLHVTQLCDAVEAFELKLRLWCRQLSSGNTAHFPRLGSLGESVKTSDFAEYVTVLQSLLDDFESRFKDVAGLQTEFKVFATPFSVVIDDVPPHFQLELIDLKCDRELHDKFCTRRTLLEFYKNFPQSRFPQLHRLAARVLSMFGSTYLCEQLFSNMRRNKSCQRNQLTDHNLKCTLRVSTAQSITPNVDYLMKNKK